MIYLRSAYFLKYLQIKLTHRLINFDNLWHFVYNVGEWFSFTALLRFSRLIPW